MDIIVFGQKYAVTEKTVSGRRDENQDSLLWAYRNGSKIEINNNGVRFEENNTCSELFMAAVCDGMGGMKDGAAASNTLVSVLTNWVKIADCPDIEGYIESLKDAIRSAEQIITENYPGSGTTIVLILGINDCWYAFHIGDSRCYLTSENEYFRTVDQSPVEDLYQNGIITEDDMIVHPMNNIISYYVGGNNVDMMVRDDLGGDWDSLTICSDGAFGYMYPSEFKELVFGDAGAETIVDVAFEKGSKDNISVVRIIRT